MKNRVILYYLFNKICEKIRDSLIANQQVLPEQKPSILKDCASGQISLRLYEGLHLLLIGFFILFTGLFLLPKLI